MMIRPLTPVDLEPFIELTVNRIMQDLHPIDLVSFGESDIRRRIARRVGEHEIVSGVGVFDQRLEAALLWGDGEHPLSETRERHVLDIATGDNCQANEQAIEHFIRQTKDERVDLIRFEVSARSTLADDLKSMGFITHYYVMRSEVVDVETHDDVHLTTDDEQTLLNKVV